MKTKFKFTLIAALLFSGITSLNAQQARLTIENNSRRSMTVKVMKNTYMGNSLYKTVTISAWSSSTVYFSSTGDYFTKTKAVLENREPVYQKGELFHVVNDDTGYSVMTLTFSITESSIPQVTGGKQISKAEFEQN